MSNEENKRIVAQGLERRKADREAAQQESRLEQYEQDMITTCNAHCADAKMQTRMDETGRLQRMEWQALQEKRREALRKERERFDRNNFQTGGGGLLLFGNQMTNIQQLKADGYKVEAEQQRLIRENVENYFGVPESVIRNEATGDVLDAFFNGAIEPFAIKLSDALTRMVFTERERNGGNRILFTANRLQYMNIQAKISMAQQLGDRGVLTIDEIRELFNYAPLPDGAGQFTPIRGEYHNVKDAGKDDDGGQEDTGEEDDNE